MASQQISAVPSRLVAFPSVSSSLHSLPQATSMSNVSLHSSSNALRAAESEAKLQKALSKTASSFTPQQGGAAYPSSSSPSPNSSDSSGGLMMRSKSKFST